MSLRDAEDEEIWAAAKRGAYIVVTKDEDFAQMAARLGPPPQVLWLRLGNSTNQRFFHGWSLSCRKRSPRSLKATRSSR